MRFIGNVSTGRTAAQLADYLYTQGFEVNLITSHSAMRPQAPLKCHFYTSFQELRERLRVELSSSHFDVLIHAAAVSDFHVVRPRDLPHQGKWSSDKDIQLTLAPNPKLVNSVREWSAAKAIRVVAFKLTDTTDKNERIEATQELMNSSGADVVVSNDFNELSELSHSGWFVPAVGTRQHFESNGQLNSLVGVWLNK